VKAFLPSAGLSNSGGGRNNSESGGPEVEERPRPKAHDGRGDKPRMEKISLLREIKLLEKLPLIAEIRRMGKRRRFSVGRLAALSGEGKKITKTKRYRKMAEDSGDVQYGTCIKGVKRPEKVVQKGWTSVRGGIIRKGDQLHHQGGFIQKLTGPEGRDSFSVLRKGNRYSGDQIKSVVGNGRRRMRATMLALHP